MAGIEENPEKAKLCLSLQGLIVKEPDLLGFLSKCLPGCGIEGRHVQFNEDQNIAQVHLPTDPIAEEINHFKKEYSSICGSYTLVLLCKNGSKKYVTSPTPPVALTSVQQTLVASVPLPLSSTQGLPMASVQSVMLKSQSSPNLEEQALHTSASVFNNHVVLYDLESDSTAAVSMVTKETLFQPSSTYTAREAFASPHQVLDQSTESIHQSMNMGAVQLSSPSSIQKVSSQGSSPTSVSVYAQPKMIKADKLDHGRCPFLETLWTSMTVTSTVKIKSPDCLSKDDLEIVFDNEEDGGEIEPNGIVIKPDQRSAFITFMDSAVAKNVADKEHWDIMDTEVTVSLYSADGKTVDNILKKVFFKHETAIVLSSVPEGLDAHYLQTVVEKHTKLVFYQDLEDAVAHTNSDETDNEEEAGAEECPNAYIFVSHPLAVIVLSSHVLQQPGVRRCIIEKLHGKKIKYSGKSTRLSAVEFPLCKAVVLKNVKPDSFKDKILRAYFKYPKASGGGAISDLSIDRPDLGQVIITFVDDQPVCKVLGRDHSKRLGPDARVLPYHPMFDEWYREEVVDPGYKPSGCTSPAREACVPSDQVLHDQTESIHQSMNMGAVQLSSPSSIQQVSSHGSSLTSDSESLYVKAEVINGNLNCERCAFLENLWTSVTVTSTVKVESSSSLNKDDLELVFDNEEDGGGAIEPNGIVIEPDRRSAAFITFKDNAVAKKVTDKRLWIVMGVQVAVSLHSINEKMVETVLKKVVFNDKTTIVVSGIPEGLDKHHLQTWIKNHTKLVFYQEDAVRSNSDETDSEEEAGTEECPNACIFVSHPLAVVVLSSHVLQQPGSRESTIEKINGKKINHSGKSKRLPAVKFPLCKAVILKKVKQASFNNEVLKTYFKNSKASGGGANADVSIDPDLSHVIVTFVDDQTVCKVLGKDHSNRLGPDARVLPYHPMFDEWYREEVVDPGYEKESKAINKEAFSIDLQEDISTFLRERSVDISAKVSHLCAIAELKESYIFIKPIVGSEWIRNWSTHCNEIVKEFVQNYSVEEIHVEGDSADWVYQAKCRMDSNKSVHTILKGSQLCIVGEASAVEKEAVMARNLAKDHVECTTEESFPLYRLQFVKSCLLEDLRKRHSKLSNLDIDVQKGKVRVFGEERHRRKFLKEISSVNPCHMLVDILVEVVEVLAHNDGRKFLDSCCTNEFCKLTYLFEEQEGIPTSDLAPATRLVIIGDNSELVQQLATKIRSSFAVNKVPISHEFQYTEQSDSWISFKRKIESDFLASLCTRNEKRHILLVCQPAIQNHLVTDIESFISQECFLEENIEFEQGQWQFLVGFPEWIKFTVTLESLNNEGDLFTTLPEKGVTKPSIGLRGFKSVVKKVIKQIQNLKRQIYHDIVRIGNPGSIKHFTSPEGTQQLKGIASNHNAIVKGFTEEEHENDQVDCHQHAIILSGSMGRCPVDIVVGDITELDSDVIVNAANSSLNHSGGLAGAIVKKGGMVIQEASTTYVNQRGQVDMGNAVLLKEHGSLFCKAIVHAVAPKWSEGGSNEEAEGYLQKAVQKSLKHTFSNHFKSIAIPALGTGIYKVPMRVCARATFNAIRAFTITNPHCDLKITLVLFSHSESETFVQMAKQYLMSTTGSSTKYSSSVTQSPHTVVAKQLSREQSLGISEQKQFPPFNSPLNRIQLCKGDLSSFSKAEVLVNTAADDLELSSGAVAQSLLKKGGSPLQDACSAYMAGMQTDKIPLWEVATTTPGNLQCQYVIHTVGGAYNRQYQNGSAEENMEAMIHKVLRECDKLKVKSVAFPSIGTGNLGFPIEEAARIMVRAIYDHLEQHPSCLLSKVHLVIYLKKTHKAFLKALQFMHTSNQSHTPGTLPNLTVTIVNANIVDQTCDGIVNVTNPALSLQGKGVEGALLKAGGQELQTECTDLTSCGEQLTPDKVFVTGPGQKGGLSCSLILHVCPQGIRNVSEIKDMVILILKEADKRGLSSLAIPAIGTGQLKCSAKEVAVEYCQAITAFMIQPRKSLREVRIVILGKDRFSNFSQSFDQEGKQRGLISRIIAGVIQFFTPREEELSDSEDSPDVIDYGKETTIVFAPPQSHVVGTSLALATEHVAFTEEFEPSQTSMLVVSIYAGSQQAVDDVKKDIESYVKENFLTLTRSHPKVARLQHQDYQSKIKAMAYERQVHIQIHSSELLNVVTVKGDKYNATAVLSSIDDFLHNIEQEDSEALTFKEKANRMLSIITWQMKNDYGTYEDFTPEQNLAIEEAFQKNPSSGVHIQTPEDFVINFQTMEKKRTGDGKFLKVKRRDWTAERTALEARAQYEDRDPHWDRMPIDPKTLAEAKCHTVKIDKDSSKSEFQEVVEGFEKTMAKDFNKSSDEAAYSDIVSIQRIQNPTLYGGYIARKKKMDKINPQGHLNERRLFHGCQSDVVDSIMFDGFNRSYCGVNAKVTYLGKATCFAVNASYSAQAKYAVPDKYGVKCMFYCRVLTGRVGMTNKDLVVPPVINEAEPNIRYDSTSFNPDDPKLFGIFNDTQAYPEYLIFFK